MIRSAFLIVASTALLDACAGPAAAASRPKAVYLAARMLKDPSAKSVLPAPPVAYRELPSLIPPGHAPARAPLNRVAAANRSAVREPRSEDYLGAVQVYPWSDGALYRLYAAPGKVSDIILQSGETLVSVAAGDTVRWIIGDTASGSGADRRTHILVKPSAVGLSTNLVIATDRRVYHVDAESHARTAMASISWTYPKDVLMALRAGAESAGVPIAPGVSIDRLNFNYRIEGDKVPWRPIRAFDDGRQVFIQFPPGLAQGEAPPLFVTGEKGRAELVNYRIRGLYYVVDRLFGAAELRMGEKHQQVVRIVRGSAGDRGGRRGR
ncbi:MAG TPA: P-type conjugative transfer protein TrbG [Sphingomicrobium sp.]|nr:P-type conjugative transfer protein TrbG [Sphingomicrobium sp.]